jgi:nitrous oxide reductase accessory protein NosL
MTKLTAASSAAIAIAVVVLALAFGCRKKSSNDFSHAVQLNKTWTSNGDSITINEVRGPSDRWITGDTYEVTGTYKLSSRDRAILGAFVTTSGPRSGGPASPEQVMEASKGEGQFRLRFRIPRDAADCPIGASCGPGVSMYPAPYGESFLRAQIQP